MNKRLRAIGALTLGAALAAASLAQTAPSAAPLDPTAPGQPAAKTSPAEMARPAMPSGADDSRPMSPDTATTGLPPGPRVQRAGSLEYVSGGAGEESRAAIERMQGGFALRNVFSGQGGEYVVPEKVTVRGASGPAAEIANAGPLLLLALRPGRYTIEAAVGGRVQRKTVTVSASEKPVQLNWNWPGA